MFFLAKLFGLLKEYNLSNKQNKIKFSFWKKSDKNYSKTKSTNKLPDQNLIAPRPKVRWKPIVFTLIGLSVLGLGVYFIFFFDREEQFFVSKIEVQSENNFKITNASGQSLTLSRNSSTIVTGTSAPIENGYFLHTTSQNNQKLFFVVIRGVDANATWFQVGSTKIIRTDAKTTSSNTNGATISIINGENISVQNLTTTESNGNGNVSLFNYLSEASNILPPPGPSWWSILISLLPILFLGFMFFFFIRSVVRNNAQGGDGGGIFGIGKTSAKITKTNVTFADVAGIEEEKNELIEIVDYLKNPNKYAVMGARTPKGVLLYGPPGTGKTLLAKAVSGEAQVPFFEVSGASFDDMFVGVGAKRVRDLFNNAKKAAPCIVFIDEIDAVASKRGRFTAGGMGGSGAADQTINQLLSEMDGFNTNSGVIIMAATNRLDSIDEAILRPGRFDRHIQVTLPDIRERVAILKIHARNKNISTKVNLEDIARRTPGFSGAQLENVLNEATLLAVRKQHTVINLDDIDEAIDRVIAGPAKKSRRVTEHERKQVSYHEAGHALVGLYTPGGDVVEKITIIPRGQAGGYTLLTPEKQEILLKSKTDLLAIIRTYLGGRAAEEIIYGPEKVSSGASDDLNKVTNVVRSMVMQLGMSSKLGLTQYIPLSGEMNGWNKLYSEQTAYAIDVEINNILQEEYKKAKAIVQEHREELELIVESLMLLETIVKTQIDYIHKHKRLPHEALKVKEKLLNEKKEHEAMKHTHTGKN